MIDVETGHPPTTLSLTAVRMKGTVGRPDKNGVSRGQEIRMFGCLQVSGRKTKSNWAGNEQ